jgi:hypothetical protein
MVHKWNTNCSLPYKYINGQTKRAMADKVAIVATLELSAMGAGLLPDKEPPFLFPTGA